MLAPPRRQPRAAPAAVRRTPQPERADARLEAELQRKAAGRAIDSGPERPRVPIECVYQRLEPPPPVILGGQSTPRMHACYPVERNQVGTTEHPR